MDFLTDTNRAGERAHQRFESNRDHEPRSKDSHKHFAITFKN